MTGWSCVACIRSRIAKVAEIDSLPLLSPGPRPKSDHDLPTTGRKSPNPSFVLVPGRNLILVYPKPAARALILTFPSPWAKSDLDLPTSCRECPKASLPQASAEPKIVICPKPAVRALTLALPQSPAET